MFQMINWVRPRYCFLTKAKENSLMLDVIYWQNLLELQIVIFLKNMWNNYW